ncbi:putative C6 transcription factor [Aspergillus fumigatus]
MQFDSLVSPTNSKVAIPRIAGSESRNASRRAKRACLGCRQKKGQIRVLELEEQIDVYDQLLRRLRFKVDVHDREVIDRVLNRVGISLQSSYAIMPWLILSIVQSFLVSGHARYLGAGKTDGRRAGGQYRNNWRANPSGRININMERSIGKNQV